MTETKDTHKGHRQRMKERAFSEGLSAFNPHQVMEFLLFYAVPQKDVSEMAHDLINKFGSVRAVLNAPKEELKQISGVGNYVADWLLNVGELIESYCELEPKDRMQVKNLKSAVEFCCANRRQVPSTWQLCMTPAGTLQLYTCICDSLAWGEPEVLRKSVDEVLSVNSRNVIIVEFTPDSVPRPEEEDKRYAELYGHILRMAGLELLDVILVGETEVVSMYRSGDYDRSKFGEAKSMLAEMYLHEEADESDYGDELPDSDDGL